jgi:acyl-CoA synthetase (AMP-forming)/AMP-acid ligase II
MQFTKGTRMTGKTRLQKGRYSIRWDAKTAEKYYADGHWVDATLADALKFAARDTPGRVLVTDGDFKLTAFELLSQAKRMAGALRSKCEAGSTISVMLPNWHEAAVIYLGATLASMVVNPILPSLRDHDLRFLLSDAQTKAVFIPSEFRRFDYAAMLARVSAEMESPPITVVLRGAVMEGQTAFADLIAEEHAATLPAIDADSVRMVMYTSGTTGRPKGVLHTHNSIHALIRQIGEHWHVAAGDRFLVPSPISHIGGSIYAFEMPLLLGTTAVLMEAWESADAVRIIGTQGITHMAGATPFLQGLLDAAKAANTHLPSLKVFICGGASVPPSLIREASDWFENAIVSRVYGSTEVPVTTVGAMAERGLNQAADSDGRPGIADVRLGTGDEIVAKGPQMMVGYLDAEDEAAAFDADGYYRTGDQGAFDADGYLSVTGRIKDLIIRNGENIAPKEIEDLLIGHPAIAEIAIVGLPDAKTGESACAVIVPAAGASPNVADLAEYLSEFGVAKFKYPESIALRDALPKNDAGKVLKHVLRAQLTK